MVSPDDRGERHIVTSRHSLLTSSSILRQEGILPQFSGLVVPGALEYA
jgi:hypothetical protein